MDKNLILCFSSIKPTGPSTKHLPTREFNYDMALDFLLKNLPKNFELLYNENTLQSLDQISHPGLKSKLKGLHVLLHNNNEGSVNKGAGEHDMCKRAWDSIQDKQNYNWVVYFTARHIIPNPWYFEFLERHDDFDAVMSNPDFHYLNYRKSEAAPSMYNDMLFAMKAPVFDAFVKSIDVSGLQEQHKNSEQHLYEFINNGGYGVKEIPSLGILRNDHQSHGWHLV